MIKWTIFICIHKNNVNDSWFALSTISIWLLWGTSTFSASAFSDCDVDLKGGVLSELYVKYLLITAGVVFCFASTERSEVYRRVLGPGVRKKMSGGSFFIFNMHFKEKVEMARIKTKEQHIWSWKLVYCSGAQEKSKNYHAW